MTYSKSHRIASQRILQAINQAKDENGAERAAVFHELPPREDLPDYYEIIKKPIALDMVRDKRSRYASWQEFLQDVYQIFHNAKTYNRRHSVIYIDAEALEEVIDNELKQLVEEKLLTAEEAVRPDLGPLPAASVASEEDVEMEDGGSPAVNKTRKGRVPVQETPDEQIMSAIIKRLRKVQRGNGKPLAPPFERLPDKAEYPDYYKLIKDPICLTQAKANIRKKVYPTVDAFVADLARIFHNAQLYNEDGSPIHQAANTLLSALEGIAAQEQRKPEPLVVKEVVPQPTTPAQEERAQVVPSKLNRRQVEKVTFKDQSYRPGDWVLLKNVNDPATPTVAQVYRCFENVDDGSFGVHVCWYFRPQQTIHRADRFFWENEVFKTNQYRDQPVSDLLGLCHVMFLTRYMKCRPRFTESQKRELFVCEFRYNFEEKRFSKIKAWKSCQPDGAREEEDQFDLDMFQSNVHPPQVLSPLLNLLPKEKNLQAFDPSARLPNNLEHADKNAPPKTGNLIICPPAVLLPSLSTDRHALTEAALRAATFVPKQRPAPPPRPPSVKTLSTPARNSPAAAEGIQQQYTYTSPYAQGAPLQAPPHSYTSPYASAGTAVVTPQAAQQIPAQQNIQRLASLGNRVHPTALTLNSPQGPQLTLEVGVKRRFLRDEQDEIIWFTVPPIDPVARTVPGQGVLGHSLAYELWRLKQDNAQQEQMS